MVCLLQVLVVVTLAVICTVVQGSDKGNQQKNKKEDRNTDLADMGNIVKSTVTNLIPHKKAKEVKQDYWAKISDDTLGPDAKKLAQKTPQKTDNWMKAYKGTVGSDAKLAQKTPQKTDYWQKAADHTINKKGGA